MAAGFGLFQAGGPALVEFDDADRVGFTGVFRAVLALAPGCADAADEIEAGVGLPGQLDRPFAVITRLPEMYAAYDLLRTLAAPPGALLIPGHDPEVLARFPVVGEDGNAVRVA